MKEMKDFFLALAMPAAKWSRWDYLIQFFFHRLPPRPHVSFFYFVVGVGAIAYMMKTDIRSGSSMLRRNLKQIRSWMETQGDAAE